MHCNSWLRTRAEDRIRDVFEAAKSNGPQSVADEDGHFEIVFHPKRRSLEELFAEDGPIKEPDTSSSARGAVNGP